VLPISILNFVFNLLATYSKQHRVSDAVRYGCTENFRDSLTTPTATFPKILWAFVPMLPPERALVSFYRPSIVTFPVICLRVSEIAAFVLQHATFSLPHLSLPKISQCSLGVGGSSFRYSEQRCWANCPCN